MSEFEDFIKKQEKLDQDIDRIRSSARSTIHQITILCSGIVGFSVTLASWDILSSEIDLQRLYTAWMLFLLTIILGFTILIFEPRIEHARRWRASILHGNINFDQIRGLSRIQRVRVNIALFRSLLRPENIYFDEIAKKEEIKKERLLLSWTLMHKLALFRQLFLFWSENLFMVLFFISLGVFITSFRPLLQ